MNVELCESGLMDIVLSAMGVVSRVFVLALCECRRERRRSLWESGICGGLKRT